MTTVPQSILTHSQRVCRLYKKALKNAFDFQANRIDYRYQCALIRQRFEVTRKETDMRKLAAMLEEGEEEVFRGKHILPAIYRDDPGGITYSRIVDPPDWVLDFWHPWEKVLYMDYFATREKRKKEYEEYYDNHILKKGEVDTTKLPYPNP